MYPVSASRPPATIAEKIVPPMPYERRVPSTLNISAKAKKTLSVATLKVRGMFSVRRLLTVQKPPSVLPAITESISPKSRPNALRSGITSYFSNVLIPK